ncbi:MAG: TetR family transcriptional regulator, partial [Calditrichia bacterium]|nr:TetR family transcriptional regulator [Calditrichia bacterium]
MRKTKEESEKTKRLLLDTALKVFSQKGYSATRLIDIAKEAGVTRGAIYWHFNNKAELYIELNKENRDRSMEIIDKVWAEDFSPVEKMRQVFIQFM